MVDLSQPGILAVMGLGWGDEGKGSWVDYLARQTQAPWVVRFNGGPQAAHHVVTPTGQTHCFAQFGAGTLVAGVRTWLAAPMWVDPLALAQEQQALHRLGIQDAYARLNIDPRCGIITPFHALLNRLRETLRGNARHGSCGMGIGEAWRDLQQADCPVLRWQDLTHPGLAGQLAEIQAHKLSQATALCTAAAIAPRTQRYHVELGLSHLPRWLAETYRYLAGHSPIGTAGPECLTPALRAGQTLIFEGAQGALLDKDYGFAPYITPSCTTFAAARQVAAELAQSVPLHRLGVLRGYAIRHGAGPLVTADTTLTAALPEPHNGTNPWQGDVRLGWFDAVAARYALHVSGGADGLLLGHLDRLAHRAQLPVCTAYRDGRGQTVTLTPPTTSTAQTQLTTYLADCQPHYQRLAGWQDQPSAVFNYGLPVAALLGVPLAGLSYGPTAVEKSWLGA